jgi:hypothetical protein
MKHTLIGVAALVATACASYPAPTKNYANAVAAVRAAEAAGAEQHPSSAEALRIARERTNAAGKSMQEGHNEEADGQAIRAYYDAEFARTLAQAHQSERRLQQIQREEQ